MNDDAPETPTPSYTEFARPSYPPPSGPPAGYQGGSAEGLDNPMGPLSNPYATQALQVQPGSRHDPRRGASDSPSTGRKRFAVGLVTAALLVGGGAGLGGAAAYDALTDDPAPAAGSTAATSSPVVSTPDEPAAEGSIEQVAAAVLPSVVKLDVSDGQQAGSGSGIILSSDGLILTNNHVVEVAGNGTGGRITVSFADGSHAEATILGTDPLTDTAVIQADGVEGLTPATIGESGAVDVGEGVVAIGSPFGLDATVTSGIVSALDRPVDVGTDTAGNATVYPAIQTDAAINPGNSGGPLVDLSGRVIGINSSIRSATSASGEAGSIGLGFAIPIDEVLPVIEQMKAGETPTHARLGVQVRDVAADSSGALVIDGAQIQSVGSGSAAGAAGLTDGDIVTKIDDTLITSSDSLVATIRSYRPGDEVEVTFERNGEEQTTTLTLDSDAESDDS